jgi:hypothetical protein
MGASLDPVATRVFPSVPKSRERKQLTIVDLKTEWLFRCSFPFAAKIKSGKLMKWGLIPHWAKNPSAPGSTINAKSETAATKPAFRNPFKYRRCLIPTDGRITGIRSWTVEVNEFIVYIAVSADGFIARRDGSVDWLDRPRPKGNYGMAEFYLSIDTCILGRKTYDRLHREVFGVQLPVLFQCFANQLDSNSSLWRVRCAQETQHSFMTRSPWSV